MRDAFEWRAAPESCVILALCTEVGVNDSKRLFVEDADAGAPLGARTSEAPVRPKVLRRPAQFSRAPSPMPSAPAEQAKLPATRAAAIPPHDTVAWHEDSRFGLVLLVLVVLANAALVAFIPYLPSLHTPPSNSTRGVASFDSSAMPNAISGRHPSKVTTYADPDAEKRLSREFNLQQYAPEQNGFSVSPKDIPAPRAESLSKP